MRQMVLDRVKSCADGLVWKRLIQENWERCTRPSIAYPVQHKMDARPFGQKVTNLAHKIGAIILVECNVVHIRESNTGLTQTIGNCLRRESSPMFDATKALLFGSRHQA